MSVKDEQVVTFDVVTFDGVMLKIAQAAKDLGAAEEREAIIRLIDALPSAQVGGPELKDRIVRAILRRGAAA